MYQQRPTKQQLEGVILSMPDLSLDIDQADTELLRLMETELPKPLSPLPPPMILEEDLTLTLGRFLPALGTAHMGNAHNIF